MKQNTKARSYLIAGGMTLVLFSLQAVLVGTTLAYAGSLAQTMGLSALFALV